MKKITLVILCLLLCSCFLAEKETPNVPIESLGTLIQPKGTYIFESSYGTIRIEYAGELERLISINDQQFVLHLKKSSGLNGVYTDGQKVPDLCEGFIGVIYEESTTLTSENPHKVKKLYTREYGYAEAPEYGFLFKAERSYKFDNYLYIGLLGCESFAVD